jgi:hypothetical protein
MSSNNKLQDNLYSFEKKLNYFQTLGLSVLGPIAIFGIAFRFLFEWTNQMSPWLLLVAIIIALAFVYGIYHAIRLDSSKYPEVSLEERRKLDARVIGMFLTKVLVALLVFSAISFLLVHFQLANYVSKDNQNPSLSLTVLNDFYFWYTFDVIPGFDICGTLDWHRNVDASNLISRVLILLYQSYFTYIVFVSVKKWRANRKIKLKQFP